jgi:hypothetical protein
MNTKKYKYIISLEGERFLCYYDLLSTDGVIIKTGFDDIDLTPNTAQMEKLEEYRAIFKQALLETDMGVNHSKTVEYIKQQYKDKLAVLREYYFNNYIHQIDGLYFRINAEYVNYYDHIKQDIDNNTSSSIFVDAKNKTVKWGGDAVFSFEKFINYYTQISQLISNKNNEYIQDQQIILQIKDEDFNGNILFDFNDPAYERAQKSYNISKNAVYPFITAALGQVNITLEDDVLYRVNINMLISDSIKICEDKQNETLKNEIIQSVEKMHIDYDNLKNIIEQNSQGDRPIDITIKKLDAILTKWTI